MLRSTNTFNQGWIPLPVFEVNIRFPPAPSAARQPWKFPQGHLKNDESFPIGGRLIPPVFRSTLMPLRRAARVAAFAFCLGAACPSNGPAQGFDATHLRQPANLDTGWLVHAGDDPAYAQPNFDDSRWTPYNASTDSLHQLFSNARPTIVWFRIHIKVAPDQTGSALLARPFISPAFEIYSNGTMLLRAGQMDPYVPYYNVAQFLVPVPNQQVGTGTLIVAIRVHAVGYNWQSPRPVLHANTLRFGPEAVLRNEKWLNAIGANASDRLDELVDFGMLLGALLLFSTQRKHMEYLWLSLWVLCQIPGVVLNDLTLFGHPIMPMHWILLDEFASFWPYLMARMYCAFVGHRVGWKLNLFLGIACLASCYYLSTAAFGALSIEGLVLAQAPVVALQLIILPLILIADICRGHRQTVVLLIPLLIYGLAQFIYTGAYALTLIPATSAWAFSVAQRLSGVTAGPIYIDFRDMADILSMVSLALIILLRSNRMSREQAVLESEVANAREVQQVILPEAVETIPGFRIESIYEPAREVGGDFFQIVPVDGGLLLVMGDVAGKGLPAAMLVSVLVGAIRTAVQYTHSPAEVLAQLNDRMIGRANGGFATALTALFSSDGNVTIANAGHLPPYLDGAEISLPGTLPLGIRGDATYETVRLRLEPGNRLTFYSDGVIEAQDKRGELFGFERGRAISTEAASEIAKAAQQFGQTDDITVVVIERERQQSAELDKERLVARPFAAPAAVTNLQ
jgi:stage II sporulation SpoE-like protein